MPGVEDFNQQIIDEFRANGGKVGGHFEGARLLLFHTTGAKSGRPRVNPLAYRRDGDRLIVFGTKAGAPTNPDWYYNVRANPRGSVEVGTEQFEVDARVAEPDERDRLWKLQTQEIPAFVEYEDQTDRTIPVVILERVA
jgi:deazaflavin-dependent oxidoreductase (nitroreductase family)